MVEVVVAAVAAPVGSLVAAALPLVMRVAPNGAGVKVPVVIGGRVFEEICHETS